jgi:hypothetical protein
MNGRRMLWYGAAALGLSALSAYDLPGSIDLLHAQLANAAILWVLA